MKISVGGDCFLGGDLNDFSGKILNTKVFDQADFRFVNLEQAASNKPIPVDKCTLYSSEKALELLTTSCSGQGEMSCREAYDLIISLL